MMLAGAVTRLVSAGMLAMMGRINLPAGLVLLSLADWVWSQNVVWEISDCGKS